MSKKRILCIVGLILLLIISYFLYINNLVKFLIVTIPLAFILLFFALKGVFESKSPEEEYNRFLKDVLRTYDAVLIDVTEIPNIDGRSIVKVSNFEDLIDAQIEFRKPIYYKRDARSTLFILLDDKQVCINILKVDEKEKSQFDDWLANQEKEKEEFDASLLASIENTTIVKLDNNKSYRISPVRENKKQKIKDSKQLEKTLTALPKLKDTVELSKTQIFKDLNRRNKK